MRTEDSHAVQELFLYMLGFFKPAASNFTIFSHCTAELGDVPGTETPAVHVATAEGNLHLHISGHQVQSQQQPHGKALHVTGTNVVA